MNGTEGFNVRTRVHEYGGAVYVVAGDTLYFSNYTDQRLSPQNPGSAPVSTHRRATAMPTVPRR